MERLETNRELTRARPELGEGFATHAALAVGPSTIQPILRCLNQRLPEFDAVTLGVGDPGKVPVGGGFLVGIDGDVGGTELGEEGFKVVHAIVDHGALGGRAEVLAGVGEEHPGGLAGTGGDFVGPEEGGTAVVGELDAEVFGVPASEGFGVAGFEEDSADSGDSCHEDLLGVGERGEEKQTSPLRHEMIPNQ